MEKEASVHVLLAYFTPEPQALDSHCPASSSQAPCKAFNIIPPDR